jgi:hypothetical protein
MRATGGRKGRNTCARTASDIVRSDSAGGLEEYLRAYGGIKRGTRGLEPRNRKGDGVKGPQDQGTLSESGEKETEETGIKDEKIELKHEDKWKIR